MRFRGLLRRSIQEISEYIPGRSTREIAEKYGLEEEGIIKLGSNENQLGPSPRAVEAVKKNASRIHIYPSRDPIRLRKALAEYVGFSIDNIVVSGNGMDGVFDTMMHLFLGEGSETLIPIPTFQYYEIATQANGGIPRFAMRSKDYSLDVGKLLEMVSRKTKIIFLCSPNNPTGNIIEEEQVRRIVESVDSIVFLDEAYVEFAEKSLTSLVREYENLVVGRTLSKAFGLAGLRIGYAVAPDWIGREYLKVEIPFSVDVLSEEAGIAALGDKEHLEETVLKVRKGRDQLASGLGGLARVYPSQGNFILVDVSPRKAGEVAEALLKKGIIVRDCSSFRGAGDSLIRITVGTEKQNDQVIEAFRSL